MTPPKMGSPGNSSMNMCAAPNGGDGVDRCRDGYTGIIRTTGQGLLPPKGAGQGLLLPKGAALASGSMRVGPWAKNQSSSIANRRELQRVIPYPVVEGAFPFSATDYAKLNSSR